MCFSSAVVHIFVYTCFPTWTIFFFVRWSVVGGSYIEVRVLIRPWHARKKMACRHTYTSKTSLRVSRGQPFLLAFRLFEVHSVADVVVVHACMGFGSNPTPRLSSCPPYETVMPCMSARPSCPRKTRSSPSSTDSRRSTRASWPSTALGAAAANRRGAPACSSPMCI